MSDTKPDPGNDKKTDRLSLLQAMGIRVWLDRAETTPAQPAVNAAGTTHTRRPARAPGPGTMQNRPPTQTLQPETIRDRPSTPVPPREGGGIEIDVSGFDWPALESAVSRCQSCDLHRGRTQTVFGTGDRSARWMIVGEAPGAEEDRQGEPFVGRAGQLLNAMLLAAGFNRRDVYIANIVKCRPPDNRDPRQEEAQSCSAYLDRQIELVQPQIILAVGRVAAQRLLKNDTPVGRMRGKLHRYGAEPGVPVVVTYHPAYLLRSPREKRKVWQDLLFALEQCEPAS